MNLEALNYRSAMDLKALQISAMHRNGINISKLRKNGLFKVETIDNSIFRSKIPQSTDCRVGYIVTKINNIDLKEYDTISAAKYLTSNDIRTIEIFSPINYMKQQRKTKYQTNKVISIMSTNQNETAIALLPQYLNKEIPATSDFSIMPAIPASHVNNNNVHQS